MNQIRTMVVDDEKEARDGMGKLLHEHPDFEVVATCENGLEAIEAIQELKPDLVFLDIQMPKINGFEVLGSLDPKALPMVIFVTAYDQYALKAFEVHAIDYLLKPFSDVRFCEAIDHAREIFKRNSRDETSLRGVIDDYSKYFDTHNAEQLIRSLKNPDQLIVKTGGKIIFIPLSEITHITAQNYYVKVHVGNNTHLVRESLKSLEDYLKDSSFIRIHKSTIVNAARIREVEPYFNGEMILKLENSVKLKVSRHYKKNLPKIFG